MTKLENFTPTKRAHDRVHGRRCWCGQYHYRCDECEIDCTLGAPGSPATTDTRNVTRCRECQREWDRLAGALRPWTQAEAAAIKAALSQIADDGDPDPITAEHRKIATEILCRAQGS